MESLDFLVLKDLFATDEYLKELETSKTKLKTSTAASDPQKQRPETMREFQKVFRPAGLRPGTLRAAYGLAEHCVYVVSQRTGGQNARVLNVGREPLDVCQDVDRTRAPYVCWLLLSPGACAGPPRIPRPPRRPHALQVLRPHPVKNESG